MFIFLKCGSYLNSVTTKSVCLVYFHFKIFQKDGSPKCHHIFTLNILISSPTFPMPFLGVLTRRFSMSISIIFMIAGLGTGKNIDYVWQNSTICFRKNASFCTAIYKTWVRNNPINHFCLGHCELYSVEVTEMKSGELVL